MRNDKKRQQGGTFLGIVIGLIIGLGVALGVAITITKTPMPFINKITRQERPAANQISDPNKPLYGNKEPAKEAAKAFVKQPETAPAEGQATAAHEDAQQENGAAVIDRSTWEAVKKEEVKTPDIKTERHSSPVAKPDNPDGKWVYYLQAGAFRDQTDAENTRARLALAGVEARISERPSENGILYRVRVGPFPQMEAMNRVRSKLTDNGVEVAVVRVLKNS